MKEAAKLAKKQQQHQAEYQGSVVRTEAEAEAEEGSEQQRHWLRQMQKLREPQRQQELSSFYFIVGKLRVVVAVVGNVAFAFAFGFASPLKCLND